MIHYDIKSILAMHSVARKSFDRSDVQFHFIEVRREEHCDWLNYLQLSNLIEDHDEHVGAYNDDRYKEDHFYRLNWRVLHTVSHFRNSLCNDI